MSVQVAGGRDLEQRVQQPGVTKVDLRRLDLTLREVLVPGRQEAHHERARQYIHIVADGHIGDRHRSAQLRPVQNLAVDVREHRPEPSQGGSWYAKAELREIPLQEGVDEVLAPT